MRRPPRPSTVVVIEDDARYSGDIQSTLARGGFRVRCTPDAAEGIDCVRQGGADVVVMGLAKRSQALDLIRRLRGRFEPIPLPAQPRIVMAVQGLHDAAEKFARRLGADVVVGKPLLGDELLNVVSRLARLQPARPATPAPIHQAS